MAKVGLEFLDDVDERPRPIDAGAHRESQATRLARSVVRVLAQDHRTDLVGRRQAQSGEHILIRGKNLGLGPLHEDELVELPDVGV